MGSCIAFMAVFPASAAPAATPNAGFVAASSGGTGWIRFGHFVPSQGPVDVTAGTTVLGKNLVFRAVTSYVSVPAGTYTVSIRSATATASAPPLATGQATVTSGGAVTAAAIAASGNSTSSNPTQGIELRMYTDDLTGPLPGQALVRVIHALPGAPVVTAQLAANATTTAASLTSQPTLSFRPIGYGQASSYTSVPAGTYDLKVGSAGKAPIVTGTNWPVTAGTISSIVLVQAASGPTVEVLSDAVAASSAPIGSMQTGFGGTAPRPIGLLLPLAAGAAVLLLGGAVARRRLLGHR
jgi:hypothetical protein